MKYKITCACGASIKGITDAKEHWACWLMHKEKFKYEKNHKGKNHKIH